MFVQTWDDLCTLTGCFIIQEYSFLNHMATTVVLDKAFNVDINMLEECMITRLGILGIIWVGNQLVVFIQVECYV